MPTSDTSPSTEAVSLTEIARDLMSRMSDHDIELLNKALALASAWEGNNGND